MKNGFREITVLYFLLELVSFFHFLLCFLSLVLSFVIRISPFYPFLFLSFSFPSLPLSSSLSTPIFHKRKIISFLFRSFPFHYQISTNYISLSLLSPSLPLLLCNIATGLQPAPGTNTATHYLRLSFLTRLSFFFLPLPSFSFFHLIPFQFPRGFTLFFLIVSQLFDIF